MTYQFFRTTTRTSLSIKSIKSIKRVIKFMDNVLSICKNGNRICDTNL